MVSKEATDPRTHAQEIAPTSQLNTDTLRNMTSLDDALTALNEAGIVVRDASEELGDGFELLNDTGKAQLVGMPFVVLEGTESDGDFGNTMVTLRLMTKDGRKVIVNDGSTGIRAQALEFIAAKGTISGLYVPHGLRASTYTFCDECKTKGKTGVQACPSCGHSPMKPAATYYLDTSK